MGTEESDHCRKVAVVERFKKESMYGLSAKKWREVAVSEASTLMFIILTYLIYGMRLNIKSFPKTCSMK